MDLGIKARRAIVTGGSSGIGFETARQFLEEGVRVLITGRNEKKLMQARDDLAKHTGGEVHAVAADMTKETDIAKMVATAKEKLGGVDILVNNAGQMYFGRFAAFKDKEMQTQLDTKLFGFLHAIRAVYPMMKAQRWGRIVNTIGGAGKEPDPYMFGSGMTNSALLNLTKSLSAEFGEDNVLVNAICPRLGGDRPLGAQHRRHEEGIRRVDRGGRPQDRRQEEFASAHGKRSPMPPCSSVRNARATSPACRSIWTAGG
jgi:3-oxoacyl-[acyl-carrier protein] reductase